MRRTRSLAVLLAACLMSGCATALVTKARLERPAVELKKEDDRWSVYPAVRLDFFLIGFFSRAAATGHDGHTDQGPVFQYVVAPAIVVGLCVDTALSLVTDTLLLPYDIYVANIEKDLVVAK